MSIAETPEVQNLADNYVGIVSSPDQAEWQAGAALEANVFMGVNYVTSPDELAEEYAPYVPASEFAVVMRDGQVAGSTRLIYNSEAGFKTLHDIEANRLTVDEAGQQALNNLDLNRTFEVGTIAVAPEMRARPEDEGRASVDLYGAIYAESRHHDCPSALASFDADYYERFKGIFGPGVKPLGPAVDYMGSPTVPVLMQIDELMDHLQASFPVMHDAMISTANNLIHS